MNAKLVEDENGCFVDCIIPRKDLFETETTGELKLFNTKSGYSDTAKCFIIARPPIDVSPSVTRFVATEDGSFKATSLVKVEPTAYPTYREKIQAASVGCKAEKGEVVIESRQIAPFLFRVYLTFKQSSAKPEKPTELYWSLSAGAETSFTKTQVFFSNVAEAPD